MRRATGPRTGGVALAPAVAMFVAGCSDIGVYRFESARLVTDRLEREFGDGTLPYPEYLAVELSSDTDLLGLDIGNGPYPEAGLCNVDDGTMAAFGPLDARGAQMHTSASAESRRDPRDGRYRFHIYVVTSRPAPGVTYAPPQFPEPDYDLRRADRDLCVWFSAPAYNGMFVPPATSNKVVVPVAALRSAFEAGARR